MTQLIDKDDLVAEIKKLSAYLDSIHEQRLIEKILSIIDALEVKDVDLEDSVKETLRQKYIDYTFKRHNIDPESREGLLIYYAYMHGMNQCLDKLKAQNEHKSCTTDE